MSAKAKSKGNASDHESGAADVAAMAAIAAAPAEPPAPTAEAPPATDVAATTPPLILRVKAATSTAVVRSFATLRAAQATAIQRTVAWLTGLDAVMARSLTTGEGFLLAKLGAQGPVAAASEASAPPS